ncbi:hypothetical protein DFS34DRAFT_605096 [Phlyctochytrium arcticum]|nr:hypothetical protein DFS34DRAFT_605096 [Phlyctochytrium arcticum]
MTFKGIRGEFNEWEIAMLEPGVLVNPSVLACVRVFTDGHDSEMYRQVVEMVDAVFPRDTGSRLLFTHIHGDSQPAIGVVVADLDGGQYKGLALYLEQLRADTTKMDWKDHLLHIFKSCQVHLKRNVLKNANGEKCKNLRLLMESICTRHDANDPKTINLLFDHIIAKGSESGLELTHWVELYKKPYILGSLNPAYSKIPLDIWNRTRHCDQTRATAWTIF